MQPTSTRNIGAMLTKLLLVALLAAPALVALPLTQSGGENRNLAPWPQRLLRIGDAQQYTAALDTWINDHFPMREALVALNTRLRYALFKQFPTSQVISGRDGRSFLAAHQPTSAPYGAILDACGFQATRTAETGQQIDRLTTLMAQQGVTLRLLVVPSAPAVYIDQLPAWLSRLCHQSTPPMTTLTGPASPLATTDVRNVYFPLDAMRSAARQAVLFPPHDFHWRGAGPRLVSDWTVQRFWNVDPASATPTQHPLRYQPSDLSHLFRGLELGGEVEALDLAASGIEECLGPACQGDALRPLDMAAELATYRNAHAARGRLLIFGDSFGLYGAPWFARYYKEVVIINTNWLDRLSAPQRVALRQFVLGRQPGTDLLVLYHDVTVTSGRIARDFHILMPEF
jgi:hypothetical protein